MIILSLFCAFEQRQVCHGVLKSSGPPYQKKFSYVVCHCIIFIINIIEYLIGSATSVDGHFPPSLRSLICNPARSQRGVSRLSGPHRGAYAWPTQWCINSYVLSHTAPSLGKLWPTFLSAYAFHQCD